MQSSATGITFRQDQLQFRLSGGARSAIEFIAVLLFFIVLTILSFWNIIPQLGSSLVGPLDDNTQDLWNSWYAATNNSFDFVSTNIIKFPEGTTLYYHSFAYPQVFVVRIFCMLFGTSLPTLILLQNVTLLASFPLAGAGAFYLVRYFVGNVGGIGSPILMGVVFQRFHSFTPAILVSAGVTLVCAVLFLVLYRVKTDREAVIAFLSR